MLPLLVMLTVHWLSAAIKAVVSTLSGTLAVASCREGAASHRTTRCEVCLNMRAVALETTDCRSGLSEMRVAPGMAAIGSVMAVGCDWS